MILKKFNNKNIVTEFKIFLILRSSRNVWMMLILNNITIIILLCNEIIVAHIKCMILNYVSIDGVIIIILLELSLTTINATYSRPQKFTAFTKLKSRICFNEAVTLFIKASMEEGWRRQ